MDSLLLAAFVIALASGITAVLMSLLKPGVLRVLAMLVVFTTALISVGEFFDPSVGSDVDYGYGLAAVWLGWPVGLLLTILLLSILDRKKNSGGEAMK